MSRKTRREIEREMDRLEALLRGETIDGITLGMRGVGAAEVREMIEARARVLVSGELS